MTAKEKAIELYNKFRDIEPVMQANVKSKKRALILVSEVISVLKDIGENLYDLQGTDSYNARCLNHDKKQYFKEVKQELEKL